MPRPVSIDGDAEDSHAVASLVGDTLQRQIDQLANDDDLLDAGEKARRFVMSLCSDQQGRLWVGCEESGVWCFDQQAAKDKQWTQYTRKNTRGPDEPNGATIEAGNWLGDDNGYALACDKLGRIWVGHLNHGVSVFNGKQWKNYGVLEGPLGERVFAIKTCPTDGDVWIATSAGLTRYSLSKDTWIYYTRAEGLPSDQASAIAFDQAGNIIVGTQCDGLAFAEAKGDYKTWRQVTCLKEYGSRVPLVPKGQGLPTNLINDVLVAKDGTIYVATTTGLAWSKDGGKNFEFIRGQEWADKVNGLMDGPPRGWKKQAVENLLAEDYVTRLAESVPGQLYVAYREKAPEIRDRAMAKTTAGEFLRDRYVTALLPANGQMLVATYYGGLSGENQLAQTGSPAARTPAALPAVAKPLTADELAAVKDRLAKLPQDDKQKAVYAGEDWLTQGDWIYRYGHQWATLCGNNWPLDQAFGRNGSDGGMPYEIKANVDPSWRMREGLRRWLHWIKSTNPKVLYNPFLGYRRQSEWDDHGESYPETEEGPDLDIEATVPTGINQISLYFMNKDGHTANCRFRDYLLELRPADAAPSTAPLARARVHDFWGGVYQRFTVAGPAKYVVKIHRNGSFATICSGVFIDKLTGPAISIDELPCPTLEYLKYAPPGQASPFTPTNVPSAADLQTAALFAYRARPASDQSLAAWRWPMRLWTQADRAEFDAKMAEGWSLVLAHNPAYGEFVARQDKRLKEARSNFRKEGMTWVPQD